MKSANFSFLTIILLVCAGACGSGPSGSNTDETMLKLRIELPKTPFYLNQPLEVRATLTNGGENNVVVNKRMSIGYEKSMARELYAEIVDASSGQPASFDPKDINRDFSTPTDYVELAPGDSLSTTFDLLDYYPLKKTGRYKFILHYHANEELASVPDNVFKGIASSKPIEIEILPGIQPQKNN